MNYRLKTIVGMKKPHACGSNSWTIIRMGADIKIRCNNCQHILMFSREKFNKVLKKIIKY